MSTIHQMPGSVNNPLSGALWMIVSCALLAALAVLGRYSAVAGVPPLEVVFFRVFFALVAMLPFLLFRGRELVRTTRLKTYGLRVAAGALSMMAWFSALSQIAVGQAMAISFLTPVLATLGAALFLGENVHMRRWTATAIGFVGALIIVRPGMVEMSSGVWLALCSTFAMAISGLSLKSLTATDDTTKIVFISVAILTPVTFIPAALVWQWPQAHVWPFLIAMGPVATLGHLAMARAFAMTDASLAMSLAYARLPFAVLFGYMVFGELIDAFTWIGASIIFAAGIYIAHREARFGKQQPAAQYTVRLPDN